jgi:hypothetical protein
MYIKLKLQKICGNFVLVWVILVFLWYLFHKIILKSKYIGSSWNTMALTFS